MSLQAAHHGRQRVGTQEGGSEPDFQQDEGDRRQEARQGQQPNQVYVAGRDRPEEE